MSKRFFSLLLLSLLFAESFAQEKAVTSPDIRISIGEPNPENKNKRYLFNGQIKGENGTALEGINLLFPTLNEGTVTNKKGKFSLRLPYGAHRFSIEGLGFKNKKYSAGFRRTKPIESSHNSSWYF